MIKCPLLCVPGCLAEGMVLSCVSIHRLFTAHRPENVANQVKLCDNVLRKEVAL